MQGTNDDHFDPREQLLTLSEEQALEYARSFINENCSERDAAYLSEVVAAGQHSTEVTYRHAVGGSPVAQLVYGTVRLHGSHIDQCVSEGLFWLTRSLNSGNAKAAIVLAGAFEEGKHVGRDAARALKYATLAADHGLPAGEFFLANLLIGVQDIPEDQERAIALLQAAARKGYAPAIKMLEENSIPPEPT
jgi:TPR repeat protein